MKTSLTTEEIIGFLESTRDPKAILHPFTQLDPKITLELVHAAQLRIAFFKEKGDTPVDALAKMLRQDKVESVTVAFMLYGFANFQMGAESGGAKMIKQMKPLIELVAKHVSKLGIEDTVEFMMELDKLKTKL